MSEKNLSLTNESLSIFCSKCGKEVAKIAIFSFPHEETAEVVCPKCNINAKKNFNSWTGEEEKGE